MSNSANTIFSSDQHRPDRFVTISLSKIEKMSDYTAGDPDFRLSQEQLHTFDRIKSNLGILGIEDIIPARLRPDPSHRDVDFWVRPLIPVLAELSTLEAPVSRILEWFRHAMGHSDVLDKDPQCTRYIHIEHVRNALNYVKEKCSIPVHASLERAQGLPPVIGSREEREDRRGDSGQRILDNKVRSGSGTPTLGAGTTAEPSPQISGIQNLDAAPSLSATEVASDLHFTSMPFQPPPAHGTDPYAPRTWNADVDPSNPDHGQAVENQFLSFYSRPDERAQFVAGQQTRRKRESAMAFELERPGSEGGVRLTGIDPAPPGNDTVYSYDMYGRQTLNPASQSAQVHPQGYDSAAPPQNPVYPWLRDVRRPTPAPVRPSFRIAKMPTQSRRSGQGIPYPGRHAGRARKASRGRSRPAPGDDDVGDDESVEYDDEGRILTFRETPLIPSHLSLPNKKELYDLQIAMAEEKKHVRYHGHRGTDHAQLAVRDRHFLEGTKLELEYKKRMMEMGL
jgi:hypothetical protein